jgi:hypothetical protein
MYQIDYILMYVLEQNILAIGPDLKDEPRGELCK